MGTIKQYFETQRYFLVPKERGGILYYWFRKYYLDTNDKITTRHDPVTIYISARNPELEARITRAVQPFVRSNEGMIGEMLGNGVCINPETSTGQNGISVGQQISQDIANYIKGRL